MVMVTAKLNKKKVVIALIIFGLLLCGAILLCRDRDAAPTASTTITVKDNQARVDFLKSLGWRLRQSLSTSERHHSQRIHRRLRGVRQNTVRAGI